MKESDPRWRKHRGAGPGGRGRRPCSAEMGRAAETGGAAPASSAAMVPMGLRVESATPREFTRVMQSKVLPWRRGGAGAAGVAAPGNRLQLDQDSVKNGLGRLVLSLVKLLHELLERQALRRVEGGYLSETEIDRLGLTLMAQAQEIDRLRRQFGLTEEDLNLDLGPLGRLF